MRSMPLLSTLALAGGAEALQPTVSSAVRPSRHAPISCSASWDRRSAVLGALGCGLLVAGPAASLAYDAIPEVAPDFGALEKARREAAVIDGQKTKALLAKVKNLEAVTKPEEFVSAADELALYVIGEKKIPEGVKIKEVVNRIKLTYDDLPSIKYKCKDTRSGICERKDIQVEDAMQQLMNQLRKYS